ncbi:uncharacterized protein LOC113981912 [Neopelma chrysocephalum]|uniref:uncharacterized protein LOC113981912 n=1 Tax=Neopelma chrysocephalum TaxID=114329 RepID=UPI000FCCEA38|nr:uncharacterized protein LOC113981912 [Neopelma chrysocephalum]
MAQVRILEEVLPHTQTRTTSTDEARQPDFQLLRRPGPEPGNTVYGEGGSSGGAPHTPLGCRAARAPRVPARRGGAPARGTGRRTRRPPPALGWAALPRSRHRAAAGPGPQPPGGEAAPRSVGWRLLQGSRASGQRAGTARHSSPVGRQHPRHGSTEYSELGGTHKDHRVQLLALHSISPRITPCAGQRCPNAFRTLSGSTGTREAEGTRGLTNLFPVGKRNRCRAGGCCFLPPLSPESRCGRQGILVSHKSPSVGAAVAMWETHTNMLQ